ncbi:flavodoxin family protein [Novosphingobium sp. Chol11]|uniref:flavodoxin family protein n=1 Tax=Novosphingobium sp. Chol11 TaxID=1385763 RepID=UPI00345B57A0
MIWHSRTGAAEAMARAAANGAALDCTVRLVAAQDVCADDLLGAGGALFVCPENLGTMSGMMKDMFDRLYYPLLGLIEGRVYATAIAAGSDGSGAQAQIDRIVKGWRLRRVADPLVINLGAQTPAQILGAKTLSDKALNQCHELGQALGAGLALGIY